jgi:biotin carboxyl carrier protein
MGKYFINIQKSSTGEKETCEVNLTDGCTVTIDGNEHSYEQKFITDNTILLRIDNQNFIIKAEKESDDNNTEFMLVCQSQSYNVACKSELDLLVEKFSAGRSAGKIKNELVSPMPGAIVKINVEEGQSLKKGDVILVLEAMKMENELRAAGDCVVQKILVEEKTSVDKNQVLIKFEIG